MKTNKALSFLFFLLFVFTLTAQEDSLMVERPTIQDTIPEEEEEKDYKPYNALAPAKAAFYSAVLPGLGQAYNGRYWKIPIAYAGLGVGVYFYINNDNQWNRYRDAYKNRLAGRKDEFTINGQERISDDGLIRAQQFYRRNKEISILVIAGVYILNIVDANVDAHLQQFNVSEDLSVKPNMDFDHFTGKSRYGLSLNYRF
ncbi:DUF5683 domain-containing protein [Salegentibacter sp. JZCK2]|uniref:DUF5683 domain-containing protein n=1 Tax=Salegentibacter tibetensis TaxID=2873600 RepID=UPI001CCCC2BD|nr:DUF5683 domain-containing protein [Salegentibacter tibetensis]MBZ9731399.1 DUF5683 domain-containing protein [Salegentibacter tibetensis]